MIDIEEVIEKLKAIARKFEKEKGVKVVTSHLPISHTFFDMVTGFICINWELVEEGISMFNLEDEKEIIEWFKHSLEHEYLHYRFREALMEELKIYTIEFLEIIPLEYRIASEMFAHRNDGMPYYIAKKISKVAKEDLQYLIIFKIRDVSDIEKLADFIAIISTTFTKEEIEELIDELDIENTKLARVLRQLNKIKDEFTTPEKAIELAKTIKKIIE